LRLMYLTVIASAPLCLVGFATPSGLLGLKDCQSPYICSNSTSARCIGQHVESKAHTVGYRLFGALPDSQKSHLSFDIGWIYQPVLVAVGAKKQVMFTNSVLNPVTPTPTDYRSIKRTEREAGQRFCKSQNMNGHPQATKVATG
jgi:hypothetical protein